MKFQALLMCVAVVAASVGLAMYVHSRRKLELQLTKHVSFQEIKLRVTRDVLGEYQQLVVQTSSLLDKTHKTVDEVGAEATAAQANLEKKTGEEGTCQEEKKRLTDEFASVNTQKSSVQSEFEKERAGWMEQISALKQQSEQKSKVCDYIDMKSAEGRTLCGIAEEAKPAAAKPVEAKPVEPKPAEPKAEAPKAEEAKADAPKRK